MPFRAKRGSDKRQVSDVLLADIVAAFDKLDSVEKIPAVYCEATDLIKLPTLTLDPVSKKLDENTTALQSLAHKVEELPSKVSTAAANPVTKCYSEIEKLISDIKVQLQQFFLVALILCPLKFPVDIHPLAPLPMSATPLVGVNLALLLQVVSSSSNLLLVVIVLIM